jgi:hypothetical protein
LGQLPEPRVDIIGPPGAPWPAHTETRPVPPVHLRSAQTAAVMCDRRESGRHECGRSPKNQTIMNSCPSRNQHSEAEQAPEDPKVGAAWSRVREVLKASCEGPLSWLRRRANFRPRGGNPACGSTFVRRSAILTVVIFAAVLGSPARADVLIGVAGPMTGKEAWLGEQDERGAGRGRHQRRWRRPRPAGAADHGGRLLRGPARCQTGIPAGMRSSPQRLAFTN